MRSVFGPIVNDAPVPLAPTRYSTGLFGVPLNRDTTSQLATTGHVGVLWQIVDRLTTSVSSVEWRLYERAASGREEDRREVTSHPALDLWNNPNPHFLRPDLIETAQQPQELIGEGILLVTRVGSSVKSLPLELWPVSPARMEPVPHPKKFIEHWWYITPEGQKLRVENEDVLRIKRPNPNDLYRGLGPIQALMSQIDSARYGAEWQRNFFINGAEPGGIIEYDENLQDDEFDIATRRWREQHQGVANAHRVAIIERGRWVERKVSLKDLGIAELQAIPDEQIRKSFGYPKPLLGSVDDVNRANAEAAEVVFARWLVNPRLERWKQLLNRRLLPMYAGRKNLEFDYDNPVPPDAEAIDRERDSKVAAAVALVGADFDPNEVLASLGMPSISYRGGGEAGLSPEAIGNLIQSLYLGTPEKAAITWDEARAILRAAGVDLPENVPAPVVAGGPPVQARAYPSHEQQLEDIRNTHIPPPVPVPLLLQMADDLARVQEQWETALDRLLDQWGPVTAAQRDTLVNQIQDLIDDGAVAELAALESDADTGAELLVAAMLGLATAAAKQQSDEASKQGVSVEPARHTEEDFEQPAAAASGLLAAGLAAAAGREALRLATPGASGREVAEQVEQFIDDLTDRQLRDQLGGQLTAAQNQGRIATLAAAPPADYYATEELDGNTCPPCRDIDGRRFDTLEEARTTYGNGGFRRCQGRERCRGTIVAVWEES